MPMAATRHSATQKRHKDKQWDQQRGTAHSRGYGYTWQKLRLCALSRDHYLCQICGVPTGTRGHVDHVTPKAIGGTDNLANLQTLCHQCHSIKTDRWHRE